MARVNLLLRAPAARPRARLSERLETLRRDVTTIARDLIGRSPAPVSRRVPLARHQMEPARRTGDLLARRSLVVERVVHETADAVSLHLADPTGAPITFSPGQFLTLHVLLPSGQSLKRAYSLSAVPGEGEAASRARITVKRIAGGKASSHLHEHARAGDVITVMGPSGHFGVSPEEAAGAHLLLIGGGSGITPLRCILEARLADPSVTVTLLYGNRAEADILFRREIDALARAHEGRLTVRYVVESAPDGWTGGVGRLDQATASAEIQRILTSEPARGRVSFALVCGPTPMMEAVRAALSSLTFPPERVREEQFASLDQKKSDIPRAPQPVTITVRDRKEDMIAAPGQTLLEAGLQAGLPMPFSCTMGGCGACKARVKSGSVVSDEPNCLSAAEVKEGFILPCISRAAGPVTLEVA
jgi:ring-1,2-phenylacetyl-CoA epoxidase subunit PaaE